MDLVRFIRLASEWAEKILVTPSGDGVRFLAVKSDWFVGVEYVSPLDGLNKPIIVELPGEVEVESAEVRDGKLVIRSKGGEEIVLGEPTDMKWRPPQAEKWYSFPLETFREVLRFAGWKKRGWRERGLLESYCYLDVRGEKLYIGACGRMFFALLRGCEEEFRVSVKLSLLAEALEAFEMAGLRPGSIAFTRGERRAVLIQLRGGWLRAYIPAALE
ncbi:MAG: hypothetical protein QW753_06850 [Thermofilum sp.]